MEAECDYDEEETPFSWLEGDSLAPPCQSELGVVHDILNLANAHRSIGPNDILFDLGCGDGRICIEAARRFGCKAVGCELEDFLVTKFRRNIQKFGLEGEVEVMSGDLRSADISRATIIFCYLLPESIIEITPMLESVIKKGALLVCNTWGPKSWKCIKYASSGPTENVNLFLYSLDSID